MQPRDPRTFLWDVAEAARAVNTFTAGMDAQSYAEFQWLYQFFSSPSNLVQTVGGAGAPGVHWRYKRQRVVF